MSVLKAQNSYMPLFRHYNHETNYISIDLYCCERQVITCACQHITIVRVINQMYIPEPTIAVNGQFVCLVCTKQYQRMAVYASHWKLRHGALVFRRWVSKLCLTNASKTLKRRNLADDPSRDAKRRCNVRAAVSYTNMTASVSEVSSAHEAKTRLDASNQSLQQLKALDFDVNLAMESDHEWNDIIIQSQNVPQSLSIKDNMKCQVQLAQLSLSDFAVCRINAQNEICVYDAINVFCNLNNPAGARKKWARIDKNTKQNFIVKRFQFRRVDGKKGRAVPVAKLEDIVKILAVVTPLNSTLLQYDVNVIHDNVQEEQVDDENMTTALNLPQSSFTNSILQGKVKLTQLSLSDFAGCRINDQREICVYDAINVFCDMNCPMGARKLWARIHKNTKQTFIVSRFQFPRVDGKLGRSVPVTKLENLVKILAVLPGMKSKVLRANMNELYDNLVSSHETTREMFARLLTDGDIKLQDGRGTQVDIALQSTLMSHEDAMYFVNTLLPIEWMRESEQESCSPDDVLTGYVYFVRVVNTDMVKIGYSRNVEIRILQLQTASPYVLILEQVCQTADFKRLERVLHQHMAAFRVRGEWFRLERSFNYLTLLQACM
jgi:hypothetical protein